MADYRYFRIGKFLACLDQSIVDAVKYAGLGYERHKLRSIGASRSVGRAVIKAVVRDRLGLLNASELVELPAFGHVGLQVHGGCKLFDFERREVVKVFTPETSSQDAVVEISASKQASEVPSAPRFIAEDPDLAWYREEFICGMHATDGGFRSGAEILDFYPDVEKCLLDLVACSPPRRIAANIHFERLADLTFRSHWLSAGLDAQKIEEISEYVRQLRDWLANQAATEELQLVLTHGDFSLVNAISTDGGLRFIDWEGIAPGGLYSDVFNFVFVERYYDRASDNFRNEMSEFIRGYRKASQERFPELREAAETDLVFARRQYYLERLSLLLNRKVSSNLCKVVCNSIALFRDFDRESGDGEV